MCTRVIKILAFFSQLSEAYQRVYEALVVDLVKDYVPESWIALVQVKSQYYEAVAHRSVGSGLCFAKGALTGKTMETLSFMYCDDEPEPAGSRPKVSTVIDIRVPKDDAERLQLGMYILFLFLSFSLCSLLSGRHAI